MVAIQANRTFTLRHCETAQTFRLTSPSDVQNGHDQWSFARSATGWTLQRLTDGYFLGVTAKRDGARVVATPIAMSWHMDAGGEGPNFPSAIRLILADVDEVFCLVLDAKGVPRLAAVACGEECKRGSRSAEQLWSLEEHEPYRNADLQSEIDRSGEGTTGWVSYLLGLSSA